MPAAPRFAVVLGFLALAGTLALHACESRGPAGPTVQPEPPEEPEPPPSVDTLDARLVSPDGREGAVVLRFPGERVLDVLSDTVEVYLRRDGDGLHAVLVAVSHFDILFQVVVEGEGIPPVEILQVADAFNALRPSLAGYSVELVP